MSLKNAHNVNLYAPAGRGKLYVAPWVNGNPPTYPGTVPTNYPTAKDIEAELGDFYEIGNCLSIEMEPTIERLPHYSKRSGIDNKDFNPIIKTEYMLNIECDELSARNLAIRVLGEMSTTGIIKGLSNVDEEYAIIFICNNPIGPNANRYFRKATLSPSGTEQFINDEYLSLAYMADGLSAESDYPDSPYFDLKYITTTTTTTTTTTSTTTTTV